MRPLRCSTYLVLATLLLPSGRLLPGETSRVALRCLVKCKVPCQVRIDGDSGLGEDAKAFFLLPPTGWGTSVPGGPSISPGSPRPCRRGPLNSSSSTPRASASSSTGWWKGTPARPWAASPGRGMPSRSGPTSLAWRSPSTKCDGMSPRTDPRPAPGRGPIDKPRRCYKLFNYLRHPLFRTGEGPCLDLKGGPQCAFQPWSSALSR
jgi:hypothetical protein